MAYTRTHQKMTNIDFTGQTADYFVGFNGAIILDIQLKWAPYTFLNVGTSEESSQGGDIHVVLADSTTSISVLGQGDNFNTPIIVPHGGVFTWSHPNYNTIIDAALTIEKLLPNPNLAIQQPGLIRGSIRLLARAEPVRQTPHSLIIEAELLVFDQNIT
tara:strand:+ start:429 stop:905 length:477 start_codon:yes stop_codon:yes gene_type:complete